jgi:hypothetical protein
MKGTIRTLIFSLACCTAAINVSAQALQPIRSSDTVKKAKPIPYTKPKGPKPISKEISVGFRLNSNGWSIFSDIGKVKAEDMKHADMFHNIRLYQVEFSEKKDPREIKSTSANGSGSNTYIYGKINNFYAVKLGWGGRKMFVGKPDPGTVSIHWVNAGGLSVGLLKPYYLNVYSDPTAIKYSESTKEQYLDQNLVEGSAGFSKGLSEVKIIPGAHFKSALHFDFSANRKNVIGVEAGANVEYYSQAVLLMAGQKPQSLFLDIFLAFQFGRRW